MSEVKELYQFSLTCKDSRDDFVSIYERLLTLENEKPYLFHSQNDDLVQLLTAFIEPKVLLNKQIGVWSREQIQFDQFKYLGKEIQLQEICQNQFFQLVMSNFINNNFRFEKYYCQIRSTLLVRCMQKEQLLPGETSLVQSYASQSFLNEFLWLPSDDDNTLLSDLEQQILNNDPSHHELLCYAMFRSLHKLSNAHIIAESLTDAPLETKPTFKLIFFDLLEEEKIKKSIKSFGKIKDTTSLSVREQYEENPYPRWVYLKKTKQSIKDLFGSLQLNLPLIQELHQNTARVLIPGCGTGQQVALLASSNPELKFLAVDLSKSSLAYAMRKTKELGLTNIDYLHGDILDIPSLGMTFDHIDCVGVIHHMQDQAKAWEILNSLLKPGGTMRIGVYSKLARIFLNYYRNKISETGLSADTKSILTFRKAIMNQANFNQLGIYKLRDFYSTSMLRDLLFHVHEHQYTVSEIKDYLDKEELKLLFFDLAKPLKERYRKQFSSDPHYRNFNNWKSFEKAMINTGQMFSFWCMKPE